MQIDISILDIPFIKSIYIIYHCVFLDPETLFLSSFEGIIGRF